MRAALIATVLIGGLLAASTAEATAKPNAVCPQIRRTPVARAAHLPAEIRRALGPIADPNGRWNVSDAISQADAHLPFRHLIAAGNMGLGRWLVVWEQGGFAHFTNVEVYRVIPRADLSMTMSKEAGAQGSDVKLLCRQVADKLRR